MPLQATSGAASYDAFGGGAAAVPNYIEDVFSTWLYNGTGTNQVINNGLDLSGKGGLVWSKVRDAIGSHLLFDTARGGSGSSALLITNSTNPVSGADYPIGNGIQFNSNGVTLGTGGSLNSASFIFSLWSFREQSKFFDVVTYTGTGTASQTVPHNLGSAPGCVIIKRTDSTSDWFVGYRTNVSEVLYLNKSDAAAVLSFNSWQFNTTTFRTPSISGSPDVNVNGATYVAYLFAHDAGGFGLTGTDNVISCGSFDGASGTQVTLGYEPQWIMFKNTSTTGNWQIVDNMRGMPVGLDDRQLLPNSSTSESDNNLVTPTATGFTWLPAAAGNAFLYIAIRRGPMKVPTTGTSVFGPDIRSGTGASVSITGTGYPIDLSIDMSRSTYQFWIWADRLRGNNRTLYSNSTSAESAGVLRTITGNPQNINLIIPAGDNPSGFNFVEYFFKRAPNFFDEVCYTGTSAVRTVTHNLAAVPELMIIKNRSSAALWLVYSSATGTDHYSVLNTTAARAQDTAVWNNTAPTASVFSLGNAWLEANQSGQNYVAYLFASCFGVSKVGSFTGTGATQVINCGFTGGARFVLIKATSTTGDWYVWDSARGIVAGDDPYLRLNTSAAEVTNTDWVDTAATGFELSNAGGNLANSNGVSYLFMAIA